MTRAIAVAVGAAVALTGTAAAGAATAGVIVAGQGMAGVRAEMTRGDVRDVLERRPTSTRRSRDAFGRKLDQYFKREQLHIVYRRGDDGYVVNQMYTTGRVLRTPKGIGVGSSEQAVRARVPDVVCGRIGRRRACQQGQANPGDTVTSFQLNDRKRVTRVAIGVILD